jgi:hypothetical protein
LDQLPPNARHAFELQLTHSAELRALVQELEEGIEAMARAVPQRPAPPQTWHPIEQAIAREAERKIIRPPFWSTWWRSGWTAAAACLLAFAGYVSWPESKPATGANSPASEVVPISLAAPQESLSPLSSVRKGSEPMFPTNVMTVAELKPAAQLTNPELASLRWQIASMREQLEQLAEVVAQQREVLAEPGRFKFFPLTSAASDAAATPAASMSPGLQRAMFYAMARDMGWLPGLSARDAQNNTATGAAKSFAGVEFVDFKSASAASQTTMSSAATTLSASASETASTAEAAPVSVASSGGIGIPGMFSKDGLILALDKTIVPSGGAVSFWKASEANDHELIGSTVVNENPTVVKIPIDQIGNGMTVSVNAFSGVSNIGFFYIVRPSTARGQFQTP